MTLGINDMAYDNWKLDTPDNHLIHLFYCDYCGDSIYKGQEYTFSFSNFHRFHNDDCYDAYLEDNDEEE